MVCRSGLVVGVGGMITVVARNAVVAGEGRLTDWISVGVLASSVPRDAVDEAVAVTGKQAKRSDGRLPPHVMVYFAMAMAPGST